MQILSYGMSPVITAVFQDSPELQAVVPNPVPFVPKTGLNSSFDKL